MRCKPLLILLIFLSLGLLSTAANSNLFTSLEPHDGDIWHRTAYHFKLDHLEYRPEVQKQIEWYKKHPTHIDHIAKRAVPYIYFILQEVLDRDLPTELALLPILESAFDPFAYSNMGAAGLWQIMPKTGEGIGLKQNWWYDGRRDVHASTHAALDYLMQLHDYFGGDWLKAIAAYDAGQTKVARAVKKNRKNHKKVDFWSLKLPRETTNYIPRLLALAAIIEDPSRYGIKLPILKDGPYLEAVDVESQIDLAQAANLAEMTTDELYKLNPAHNRWATDPDGPHVILLPLNKVELFKNNLSMLPKKHRVSWRLHKVKNNETLSGIAKEYKTTVKLLKTVNHLNSDNIAINQTLHIPYATSKIAEYLLKAKDKYYAHYLKYQGPQKIEHTVKKGESLWLIAKKHKVKIADLKRWNKLKDSSVIRPGQKLVVNV